MHNQFPYKQGSDRSVASKDANAKPLQSLAFRLLPAGEYLVTAVASEKKRAKVGKSEYLEVRFKVIEGAHQGIQVSERFQLWHPSLKAVEIGKGNLTELCHAVGVLQPRDSSELHNRPIIITVGLRKRDDNGSIVNCITGYQKVLNNSSTLKYTTVRSTPWKR